MKSRNNYLEMKCLLITDDEISNHVDYLKDKMIRIPESDPNIYQKSTI